MQDIDKSKRSSRIPRSIWLPLLLFIYLGAMTAWFANELIAGGETGRLISVIAIELIILLLLHLTLKKKESQNR